MDSIIFISISVLVIIVSLAIRYRREVMQEDSKEYTFSLEKINRDRYIVRDANDPITFSTDMFQKELYTQDKETSSSKFTTGLLDARDNEEVLTFLKTRLMEAFKLREVYQTTLASSNDEQYRESSVMGIAIDRLREYESETDLVHYSALLLDAFDKDREYKYGRRKEQLYKTRYIFGSVQAIIEDEIELLEYFSEGIMNQIHTEKEMIEIHFHKLYEENQ